MKEFIEKLIGRLEEISAENTCSDCPYKSRCDEVQEQVKDETTDLCGATIKSLAISIVNQLAEEYSHGEFGVSGQWVPADEPPKDNKYVLLSFANLSVPMVGRYEEDPDGNGAYYLTNEDVPLVLQDMIVNAWMPLPKSYRPEGE